VNRGCLPSKNLIEASKLVFDVRHPRYPDLRGAELGLDFGELIAHKDEVIAAYREKKYLSIFDGGVTIEQGRARLAEALTIELDGRDGIKRLTGRSGPHCPRIRPGTSRDSRACRHAVPDE
jgi:mercuric reductase